jgi:hypothetical protein
VSLGALCLRQSIAEGSDSWGHTLTIRRAKFLHHRSYLASAPQRAVASAIALTTQLSRPGGACGAPSTPPRPQPQTPHDGASPKPALHKMGVKPGMRIAIVNAPAGIPSRSSPSTAPGPRYAFAPSSTSRRPAPAAQRRERGWRLTAGLTSVPWPSTSPPASLPPCVPSSFPSGQLHSGPDAPPVRAS